MAPQRLTHNASFSPEQLRIMRGAFDAAWVKIAPAVSSKPRSVEAARSKLADIVMRLAETEVGTTEELTARILSAAFAEPREIDRQDSN